MKYYTDCDCWRDHFRVFDSEAEARKDFEERKDCQKKILYKIDDNGKLVELEEKCS